jgi:negative regulator of sigma E activity
MNEAIRMQISAFVDGELPENESELLLRRLSQDAELRDQVSDYLAIGRAMRGEAGFAGAAELRERVLAEIDEREPLHAAVADSASPRSLWKPIGGAAVAAAVALLAIVGFQQTNVDSGDAGALLANDIVNTVEGESYTVPPSDEMLRQYILSHEAATADSGANGFNSRMVTLQFSQQLEDEAAQVEDEDSGDEADANAASDDQ